MDRRRYAKGIFDAGRNKTDQSDIVSHAGLSVTAITPCAPGLVSRGGACVKWYPERRRRGFRGGRQQSPLPD